jgi:hypothetical protein
LSIICSLRRFSARACRTAACDQNNCRKTRLSQSPEQTAFHRPIQAFRAAPQRASRSQALHSRPALFNRLNNSPIAAHFRPWVAQPAPRIQAIHAIYANTNTGTLFSICVNLRNLRMNSYPQISQIYADKDIPPTHGL